MSKNSLTLAITTIGDLLGAGKITRDQEGKPIEEVGLKIPDYQRPYKWKAENANQLLDDILGAQTDNKEVYRVGTLILHKTKFGRYVYAIGSNEEATRLSGIKVDNWKVAVYTLSGFFIGMCALFYAAAYTTITPGTGAGQEMNGITGVIIGGTSMSGGSGTMVGTLIGVFIMSVLKTGLANCGLQAPWQTFLTGAVVIGAVLLDIARTKAANRVKKG